MKRIFTLMILGLAIVTAANAQRAPKFPGLQKSPTDIAYMKDGNDVVAKVVYSRPYVNGREIFGDLVPYGKVWRTGADEATEITFYRDVTFGGTEVAAGTYSLFTIPNEGEWDVILNSDLHQWGAYRRKASNDVYTVKAEVGSLDESVENFAIVFTKDGKMAMAWDKTMAAVTVE
ncbi:MAG TPA: hypothetical protein DCE41_32210 [Cytophagales bacterium]|nr:hypothetical protein [Cytophagales bacterium]HAA19007.1 hypothetical protein [Cytophagales bacterium]HAP61817.1 hypothetical protein [Cytophagales bacterium]